MHASLTRGQQPADSDLLARLAAEAAAHAAGSRGTEK